MLLLLLLVWRWHGTTVERNFFRPRQHEIYFCYPEMITWRDLVEVFLLMQLFFRTRCCVLFGWLALKRWLATVDVDIVLTNT